MSKRERLAWLIGVISSSANKSEVGGFHSLEFAFIELDIYDFDQTENQDLWEELREVLREHPRLVEENETYKQLNRPEKVKEDSWWYDPESWK